METNLAEKLFSEISPEERPAYVSAWRVIQAEKAAARGDILGWGKALFPHILTLPFCNEMHGYFVSVRNEERTNTEAPRNHAKTTIKCFLIPMYQAIHEPESYQHYLNVQSTDNKALAINTLIKGEFENNLELRELYGDMRSAKWTDGQFVLRNGVVFTAVSTGQSIRGMHYKTKRPDYLMVDDLYDTDDINNPESTRKKNDWFWGTLYPARAQHKKASIHIQGTAINDYDLLHILKDNKEWKSKSFKSYDPQTLLPLWPEFKTYAALMTDRYNMSSVIFDREMQNERRNDANSIIKKAYLQYYDPINLLPRLNSNFRLLSTVLGVDPSIAKKLDLKKNDSDFTAAVLIYKTRQMDSQAEHFWIDSIWNGRYNFMERIDLLQKIYTNQPKQFPITQCPIEGISGFADFVSEAKRRTALPVKAVDWVQDKMTRLENHAKYFEQGRVHISNAISQEMRQLLEDQLVINNPKYDDVRDAVFLALDAGETGNWASWL